MVTVAIPVVVSRLVVTKSSAHDDVDENWIREQFRIPLAPPPVKHWAERPRASVLETRIMVYHADSLFITTS
jgi:hypothetical protein